jgi:hypothetical protein
MAGLPIANTALFRLAGAANAAGLWFDTRNLTPSRLTGGPNLPQNPPTLRPAVPTVQLPAGGYSADLVVPFLLPPVGGFGPGFGHCHERAALGGPAGNPCAVFPVVLPPALTPPRAVAILNAFGPPGKFCLTNGGDYVGATVHLPGYQICTLCIEEIKDQTWYTTIVQSLHAIPPMLGAGLPIPAQPIATWDEFQTLLCRECEQFEMALFQRRFAAGIAAGGPGAAFMVGHIHDYPLVTCTCARHLALNRTAAGDLCTEHRFYTAGDAHNVRLIKRQQNDKWLRQTGRHPTNPNRIIKISAQAERGRATRRVYRACRCGREPQANGIAPRVTLCLGCEGVVSDTHEALAERSRCS